MLDEFEEALCYVKMEKDGFVWEATLIQHSVTNDFKIKREWVKNKKPTSISTTWNFKNNNKYFWKIKQKLLNGYSLVNRVDPKNQLDFLNKDPLVKPF